MGFQSAKNQYLATLVVNLYVFAFSIFQSWGTIEYFIYYDTIRIEPSMLLHFGQFIGCILFGLISMKFGRKIPLLYISIPMIICCLINLCVHYPYCFSGSMFVAGVHGGGVVVLGILYILEIANDRFRGTMLSSLLLSSTLGQYLGFNLANLAPYGILGFVLLLNLISAISFYFLPETPLFLVKKYELQKAEESIRFYKNIRKADEYQLETLEEIAKLKKAIAYDGMEAIQMSPLRWADFKTEHARKVLKIGSILMVLMTFDGSIRMSERVVQVINRAQNNITISSVFGIASIVTILSAVACMQLVDIIGRKVLILVSAVGVSLPYLIYGFYIIFVPPHSGLWYNVWILVICFILIHFFGSLGIQTLTNTIISEIMPQRLKDVGIPVFIASGYILSYVFRTLSVFVIGYANEYLWVFISAIICSAGAIFLHLKMPETKGKSYGEIMESL